MSLLAEANSCLSIQPPSQPAGQQPSPGGMQPHSHHPEPGWTNPTTRHPHLTRLCGFQGAARLWGTDNADVRLSLRADRYFLILNPVSSSAVPFRMFPHALVPTETWRQSTNVLVIWSWLIGRQIWKMTPAQGYLDAPP